MSIRDIRLRELLEKTRADYDAARDRYVAEVESELDAKDRRIAELETMVQRRDAQGQLAGDRITGLELRLSIATELNVGDRKQIADLESQLAASRDIIRHFEQERDSWPAASAAGEVQSTQGPATIGGDMSDEKLHRVLSSGGRQGRISQLRATLRECNRLMEPMPSMAMAELDRLEREEKMCQEYEASISTTCARCSATIDPGAVEDHVRWNSLADGRWVADGAVTEVGKRSVSMRVTSIGSNNMANTLAIGGSTQVNRDALRHLQRPGQAEPSRVVDRCHGTIGLHGRQCEATTTEYTGPLGGWMCHEHEDHELQDAMEQFTPILPPEVDPLDVKYDGVTLRDVMGAFELLQREHHLMQWSGDTLVRYGNDMPPWFRRQGGFTPDQRAAVSAHWSAELRQRISAAKERERLTVRVDAQDED